MPKAPKSTILIDGENLVCRYQDMIEGGNTPLKEVKHREDVYVWSPKLVLEEEFNDILRIVYYTSAVGDDDLLFVIKQELQAIKYTTTVDAMGGVSARGNISYWRSTGAIVPRVFKKPSRAVKSKGVDIAIAIDMLNYASMDRIDDIVIVTGDGDFIPLIHEAMHTGTRVTVKALSKGLNRELEIAADNFECIDGSFFDTQPEGKKE